MNEPLRATRESPVSPLPPGEAAQAPPLRAALEDMDPRITSIQPGGGACMRIELGWGGFRRWYLSRFRSGYVARMAACRQGEPTGVPHEVLDPRDLKFYRNQTDCCWALADDPFAWRERLPFTRPGLAELIIFVGLSLIVAVAAVAFFWPLVIFPLVFAALTVWFFRNPRRVAPTGLGLVVSPADGLIAGVEEVEYDAYVGGPAVVVGIFLSIFNVHVNRSPVAARVIGVQYRPGKFLNALRSASARENEQVEVRLEENLPPYRRMAVRQIAGAIARRIVCVVKPGDHLERGAAFGMIKLGSRTELVLPKQHGMAVCVQQGERVKAGITILARYER